MWIVLFYHRSVLLLSLKKFFFTKMTVLAWQSGSWPLELIITEMFYQYKSFLKCCFLRQLFWRLLKSQPLLEWSDVLGSVCSCIHRSVCPSICLKIYTLVFSNIWHVIRGPCRVVHKIVEFFSKTCLCVKMENAHFSTILKNFVISFCSKHF